MVVPYSGARLTAPRAAGGLEGGCLVRGFIGRFRPWTAGKN